MTRIEQLMEEYKKVKKETREQKEISAQYNLKNELNEFFEVIKGYGKQIDGYSNDIKIKLELINGAGNYENFIIKFSPYNYDKDMDNYLVGYWEEDAVDKCYICYDFNPDFKEKDKEEIVDGETRTYLPALSFVFLQLYGQKERVYDLMENKIKSDLTRKINLEKRLFEMYKKNKK